MFSSFLKSFYKIYIFILFLFIGCLGEKFLFQLTPKAHKGFIDLQNINWDETKEIRLDGEWKFHWNVLLSEVESNESEIYTNVPGIWTDDLEKPSYGYASYSLEVLLPEGSKEIGIYCYDAATAFRVYWNGRLVTHAGKIGKTLGDYEPSYSSYIGSIPEVKTKNFLVVEVANFKHHKGGLWESIIIGKKEYLDKQRTRNGLIHLFALGSFWITALYHIGLYSSRKRDSVELYFGVFCFTMGWRFLLINDRVLFFFFPEVKWEIGNFLDYMSAYLSAPFFVLMIYRLFTRYFSKTILRVYVYYSIILAFSFLVLPFYYASMTIFPFQIGLIIIFIYIIYVYINAISRGTQAGIVAFTGLVVLFACIINDLLFLNLVIQTGNYLVFGLIFFIFSHSFLLSKRLSKAFFTAEKLADRLKKSNANLRNLKVDLEQKVHERTKELVKERTRAELIGRMTSEIVHDLKNPISTIMGFSEMANLDDIGKEARMEYLEIIQSESIRLADMSQGILDYVRGGAKVEAEKVNLEDFVYEIYKILKPEFRNADIEFSINKKTSGFVFFDKELMRRVVLNISINGLQALLMCEKPEKRFEMNFYFDKNLFVMEFSDNGPGIPDEIRERIFEPFVSYGKKNGTGLGMALTKEIIESHKGKIFFKTEQNVGTTFFIQIPLDGEKHA